MLAWGKNNQVSHLATFTLSSNNSEFFKLARNEEHTAVLGMRGKVREGLDSVTRGHLG